MQNTTMYNIKQNIAYVNIRALFEPLRRVIFGRDQNISSLLTSASDLGVWPECWVVAEFLHAPILWNTTTTTLQQANMIIDQGLIAWSRKQRVTLSDKASINARISVRYPI